MAAAFQFSGEPVFIERFGHGHINETYAVYFKFEYSRPIRYIMQKINTLVFRTPDKLMENIVSVTEYLRGKVAAAGGNPAREVLTVVPAKDGGFMAQDASGDYWRAYVFVEDATSYQTVERPELFYQSARAFGRFQRLLDSYPAEKLHETIPDFHNTPKRFADFCAATARDTTGRAAAVRKEIDFLMARESEYGHITNMLASGEIPLRVTHNDTKLNNVMIDNQTGEGVCVIDLDTVMPGSALYDFGDSIRFGTNPAGEDERDLSKVVFRMDLYRQYREGFLSEANLTAKEVANLRLGAKLMTLENAMRFLADHLNGDVYFRIQREGQNLDRARTQIKLAQEMEIQFNDM